MSVVNTETGELVESVTREHAKRWAERARLDLEGGADRIESGLTKVRTAISERHDLAMRDKYRSLTDYVAGEYGGALTQIGKVLGVDARRPVVSELTDAGMSTRAIGSVLGVDNATVHRDLRRVAGATPQTPEPATEGEAEADPGQTPQGEDAPGPAPQTQPVERTAPRPAVTGMDGKTYSRPEPKPAADFGNPVTAWRRNYMAAIAAVGRLMTVEPDDVAKNADHDLIEELRRVTRDLDNYTARVSDRLPAGLTVIKGER